MIKKFIIKPYMILNISDEMIIYLTFISAVLIGLQGWYYDFWNNNKVRSTICYIIAIILFIVVIFMVVR